MQECILIDSVNVSNCAYITYRDSDNPICSETGSYCKGYIICYFKQLQREKDKNAALNDSNKHAMRALNTYDNLNKKYYNAIKLIHDTTTDENAKEIARIAIYTGREEGK